MSRRTVSKSPHTPCRISICGARRRGLCRFGHAGPKAVETESVEKALAARAAGPEYVVVTGGVSNLGRAPLPTIVSDVVIARDDDPPGSPADLSLWRGVTRRLSQGLKVTVTARPNEIAPKGAPFLKDVDDLYRCDADLVPIPAVMAPNLEHGRLGDAVDNAILDTLSLPRSSGGKPRAQERGAAARDPFRRARRQGRRISSRSE